MSRPTVLLYNLDSEKGRRIKLLCLTLKFRARSVPHEQFGLPLADLLDGASPDGTDGSAFSEEMLVMAGFDSAQVDLLLQGFRRKKIPSVALKAVTTPSNLQWDSRRLRDELLAEHQAMQEGQRASHQTE